MARKYIDYLKDQLYYWKKKLDEVSDKDYYTKMWVEQMYETFRERIERYREKSK